MWGIWDERINEFCRYYSLDYSREKEKEGLVLYHFSTKETAENALSLRQELCGGLYKNLKLKVKEIPPSEPLWDYL